MTQNWQNHTPAGHPNLVVDDCPDSLEPTYHRLPEAKGHRAGTAADSTAAPAVRGGIQVASSTQRPLRVLVVDDEETARRSLVIYLRRLGHQVTEAGDGREALGLLGEGVGEAEYDVILSDLRMPGISGDQLLRMLQERGDRLYRRIIFLSGDEPSGDAVSTLAAAGSPVVLKPYDLREVVRLVEIYGGRPGGESDVA